MEFAASVLILDWLKKQKRWKDIWNYEILHAFHCFTISGQIDECVNVRFLWFQCSAIASMFCRRCRVEWEDESEWLAQLM